jgi:hypothetical protein
MPLAGWCRECGEWVWVDEDGQCQHGHGAGCLQDIHEQQDPDEADRGFGVGSMPAELHRFNWGAFFVPIAWGVVHGAWPVVAVWAAAALIPVAIAGIFGADGSLFGNLVLTTVAAEISSGVVRLWCGVNANRVLWRREAVRIESLEGASPRFFLKRYLKRQQQWTVWSAVLVGVSFVVAVPFAAQLWADYGLTYIGAALPAVWLGAEIFLGLWLDASMKSEPPDIERAARSRA